MSRIYFRCVPFDKSAVTLALESGVDGVIAPANMWNRWRGLARGRCLGRRGYPPGRPDFQGRRRSRAGPSAPGRARGAGARLGGHPRREPSGPKRHGAGRSRHPGGGPPGRGNFGTRRGGHCFFPARPRSSKRWCPSASWRSRGKPSCRGDHPRGIRGSGAPRLRGYPFPAAPGPGHAGGQFQRLHLSGARRNGTQRIRGRPALPGQCRGPCTPTPVCPTTRPPTWANCAPGRRCLLWTRRARPTLATLGRVKIEVRPMLLIEAQPKPKTAPARRGLPAECETTRLTAPDGAP